MHESVGNFEDFYNEFSEDMLIQQLQKSEDDIKAGRTISFSEFREKASDDVWNQIEAFSKYLKKADCLNLAPIEAVSS